MLHLANGLNCVGRKVGGGNKHTLANLVAGENSDKLIDFGTRDFTLPPFTLDIDFIYAKTILENNSVNAVIGSDGRALSRVFVKPVAHSEH